MNKFSTMFDIRKHVVCLDNMALLSDFDTYKFYLFFIGPTAPSQAQFKITTTEGKIATEYETITSPNGTNNIDCPEYPGLVSTNEGEMKVIISPTFFERKWQNFYSNPTFFLFRQFVKFLRASQASICGINL